MYTPHNLRTAVEYVNGAAERHFTYNTEHTAKEFARAKRLLREIQDKRFA